MNAESILQAVQEKYLSISSYSDFGTVDTVPGHTPTEFRTYFVRPSKFRFEWREWHPYFGKKKSSNDAAIWSDGNECYEWFLGKLERTDRASAVAGATGVSSASVLMILGVLYPELIDYNDPWLKMRDIEQLEDEKIRSHSCLHLMGTTTKRNDQEVWIGKTDYIVHRLRTRAEITAEEIRLMAEECEQSGVNNFSTADEQIVARNFCDEYNYHEITINQPLSDDLFAYDSSKPPAMSSAWK